MRKLFRYVVLLGIFCFSSLGYYTGISTEVPGPASREYLFSHEGEHRAYEKGIPPYDNLLIVLSRRSKDVPHEALQSAKESLVVELRKVQFDGTALFPKINTDGIGVGSDGDFVSVDQKSILIQAEPVVSLDRASRALQSLPSLLRAWNDTHPLFTVQYVSGGTFDQEVLDLIHRDLDRSLIFTLPLTIAILWWAFGSWLASLIPLGVALVSLLISIGLTGVVSYVFGPVSATALQLVVLLVLAIGVDYSLFILTRVTEEYQRGESVDTSVHIAMQTTGRAVTWSGITVALSLLGLLLMRDSVLSSMAEVSILSVFVTLGSCLLLLPWLLRRYSYRLKGVSTDGYKASGITARWLKLSVRHPILMLTIGISVLVAASLPMLRTSLGSTLTPSLFPPSLQSAAAVASLTESFPRAFGDSFSLIVHSPDGSVETSEFIESLVDEVGSEQGVRGPFSVRISEDKSTARYSYLVDGDGNDEANRSLVRTLREHLFPRALEGSNASAYVSGTLAYEVDEEEHYRTYGPRVFLSVLALSALLLLVAFRSFVIPLKAIALNLMATTASFGCMVLLFQDGLVPAWHFGVIECFIPALLFALLFGLSMDYHVFMVSRVREEYLKDGDTIRAVEESLCACAGTINNAALIMISVFVIIATLELPLMKQLGVGLAIAVFLDATIVRTVVLPASLVLLGRWNWYLPRWLEWIPEFERK